MEVIDLDSDDNSNEKSKKLKKKLNTSCINFKCKSGADVKLAPGFVCSYYGVSTKKKKKRFICTKCFEAAIEHQESLAQALYQRKPLLTCEFPDHTMEVEISDSDDSDAYDDTDNFSNNFIPEDVLLGIEEKIEDALSSICQKYDIDYQIRETHRILKKEYDKITDANNDLDDEIRLMTIKMDKIRNNLYEEYKPTIKQLEAIQIDDGGPIRPVPPREVATKRTTRVYVQTSTAPVTPVTPVVPLPPAVPAAPVAPVEANKQKTQPTITDSQPEVMPVEEKNKEKLQHGLPPHGQLLRKPATIESSVLVMKHPLIPWRKAKVMSIISRTPLTYRVKYTLKKFNNQTKNVRGKELAIHEPCSVVIPVATRVVALFTDTKTSNYYSGVIAEPPKATNRYRYLVFFDDGYAQYVEHKFIYVVSESSPRVWEDIPVESRDFVKKYLETYPERPMVKLQPEQIVKTEWNGKWWIARVIQVDASLVQMHFDADGRTEWIYRGSARLGPLYLELLKANARQQGHHASINAHSRNRLTGNVNKSNLPYVEYTSNIDQDAESATIRRSPRENKSAPTAPVTPAPIVLQPPAPTVLQTPTPIAARAVAKKSTAKRQIMQQQQQQIQQQQLLMLQQQPDSLTAYMGETESKPSHSIVYFQTQNKIETRTFTAHQCGPLCIDAIKITPEDLKGYSPLSIPLLCGWNRQLCRFPKGKKVTIYQAPCGVRLRNMEEVHYYLRITKSIMSVDLFDFDHWVHCLAEFVLDKCFVNIKDLSYGVENVPIPCVNEIDHALPDTIKYTTIREPTEGVRLNTDPEFLCSCDCEDDCSDKSKCQCWQLTIQGATFGGRIPGNAVGYVYKRLPEPVTTGIYECNSRCKCSIKTCLNRVVQHPLSLKLQVFKTAPRGWGIRCLNDIPHGSFICIYAGRLLTEQGANEGGKNYGDEYLAELDYVEVVEGIKENFEADAYEPNADYSNDPIINSKKNDDENKKKDDDDNEDSQFGFDYTKINSYGDNKTKRKRIRKKKTDEIDIDEMGIELDCSDEEDEGNNGRRKPSRFEPSVEPNQVERSKFKSVRDFFGEEEAVYIMDAKTTGNIGRYLNHSCDPNVFVQNVFVDTHDVRFPWVAFFALNFIRAGQELTWNYSYDVGSIPGKVIICKCGASNCRGRLL